MLSAAWEPRALCNPNDLLGLVSAADSSLVLQECLGIFVLTHPIGIEILSE